jgi:hypothetical protein
MYMEVNQINPVPLQVDDFAFPPRKFKLKPRRQDEGRVLQAQHVCVMQIRMDLPHLLVGKAFGPAPAKSSGVESNLMRWTQKQYLARPLITAGASEKIYGSMTSDV